MRKPDLQIRRTFRIRTVSLLAMVLVAGLVGFYVWPSDFGHADPELSKVEDSRQSTSVEIATDSGSLTLTEARGRQIYQTGESSSGVPIVANLGDSQTGIPGAALVCLNCHGADGHGEPEGGIYPSVVTWSALTRPYVARLEGGRRREPYNERLLRRAITMGIDPSGNPLNRAMPRYNLSQQDLDDLIAWLRKIGTDLPPGVTETSIRVGVLLPPTETFAELNRAVSATLAAFFEQLNSSGGLYSRRIDVRTVAAPSDPQQRMAALQKLMEREEPFVVLNVWMEGAESELRPSLSNVSVPVICPMTVAPPITEAPFSNVFHLYSGLRGQVSVLANLHRRRSGVESALTAVICRESGRSRKLADVVSSSLVGSNPSVVPVDDQAATESLARRMKQDEVRVVFLIDYGDVERQLLREAAQIGWLPAIFASGSLTGREVLDAPEAFQGRIMLAFCGSGGTLGASDERFREFVERHKLADMDAAVVQDTYASASILVKALTDAGSDVRHATLIESLEQMHEFNTGVLSPVSFGPNRRVGIRAVSVFSVDLRRQQLILVHEQEAETD